MLLIVSVALIHQSSLLLTSSLDISNLLAASTLSVCGS